MKKKFCTLATCLLVSSLGLWSSPVTAAQFACYPRLETGMMDYTIQHEALSKTTLSPFGKTSGYNMTREKSEYSDMLRFVGGGVTFLVHRLYIDLYGQYAFKGSDNTHGSLSTYNENDAFDDGERVESFVSYDYERKATFDHTDYAISIGYTISKAFSVFAGYKWADSERHFTTDGVMDIFLPQTSILTKSIDIHRETDGEFKYEGPFVGAIHGWEIDQWGFLKGIISAKLGLGYLNGKYVTNTNNQFTYADNTVYHYNERDEYKGNTWGFTLGIGWRGRTSIENLSYSLDIGGYRYSFNASNDVEYNLGDISENLISYKVGMTYAF